MGKQDGEEQRGTGVLPLRVKMTLSEPELSLVTVPWGKGNKTMQVPESGPNDVIPSGVSERDWLAWRCMRDTLKWFYENRSKNVVQACKATGWDRRYWYSIRDNEYVQSEMMRLANVNRAAEFMAINTRWMDVLRAQLAIASDHQADPRASTAAAKWLGERLDRIDSEDSDIFGNAAGRKSRARQNLERLMQAAAGQEVTVERTERITVGKGGTDLDDQTIDGEATVVRDVGDLVP